MGGYFLYQIAMLEDADLSRRAEIHRMVNEARRERRAGRHLPGGSPRRRAPWRRTGDPNA